MKKILNEYGLIAVLLFISVGGYLALGDQKEDFLSDPLDAIEARFAGLMADDESKSELSESYAEFRQKVMDKEITPEQLESVAATVLNFEASGEDVSWEEADMVLTLAGGPTETVLPGPGVMPGPSTPPSASETPYAPTMNSDRMDALPVPSSRSSGHRHAPADTSPERYKVANARVTEAFAFADGMDAMARDRPGRSGLRSHVKFVMRDGFAIVVDSGAVQMWNDEKVRDFTREFERNQKVRFENDMQAAMSSSESQYDHQRWLIAKAETLNLESQVHKNYLIAIERLHKLQDMGMVVELDTAHIRESIELGIEIMTLELEGTGADEEGARARIRVNSN